MRKRKPRALLSSVAALAAWWTLGGAVIARPLHTELSSAQPAAGSVESGEVREIRLRFTTAVQAPLSAIRLLGPRGVVDVGPVESVPESGDAGIRVALASALLDGAYTVEWSTAGPDNHVIRGTLAFTVTRPQADTPIAGPAGAAPARPEQADSVESPRGGGESLYGPGGLTVNVFFLLSVIGMIGTVTFRLGVVGPLARDGVHAETARALAVHMLGTGWAVAALALASLPSRLAYQAYLLAGLDGDMGASALALLQTTWGTAWLLQAFAVAVFIGGLVMAARDPSAGRPWRVAAAGALPAALVPALSGHAVASGPLVATVDVIHMLSASTWMGGLACLVLVGAPLAATGGGPSPVLFPMVLRFTRIALPSAGALVLSGVANALSHVSPSDLLDTPYGRILLAKVIVATGAIGAGFYNWRVVRPALARDPSSNRLLKPARIELAFLIVVLVITAALVLIANP